MNIFDFIDKCQPYMIISFRADLCGNGEGPTVAFLAEYDALNGIGHRDRCIFLNSHSFFVVKKQSKSSKMSDSIREMNESYS